uniref:Uncharacterized protein n=1 Tax=Geobacter metallireducens TaxID=28232 RepID=A0A831UBK6_GEOME
MIVRKRSAGDYVDAKCTRCRAVLNHTIVAMVGERIVRVQCNTCGGQHNYHPPQEEKKPVERSTASRAGAPRALSAGRPRREPLPAGPSEWEQRMEQADPAAAAPYAMDRSFRSGEIVSHPVFGVGFVLTVTKPNKAEILFRDGVKLLRCTL